MSRAVVLSDMFCHYKAPESFSASNLFLPWKKLTNPSNAQLKIIPNKCIIYSLSNIYRKRHSFSKNKCKFVPSFQASVLAVIYIYMRHRPMYHIDIISHSPHMFFLPDLHIRRWRGLRWSSTRRLPSQWPRFKTVFQLGTISCCVCGKQNSIFFKPV